VFAPKLTTSNSLLRFVMDEFEVKTARNYAVSLKNFESFLIDQYKAGISPVLLVDEAQNFTRDMLKLVHHLFNFSTNTEFLIQVALFGQNNLHEAIERYASLKSRMIPARLKPFTLDETTQMMDFRWHVAGGERSPFGTEAMTEAWIEILFWKQPPKYLLPMAISNYGYLYTTGRPIEAETKNPLRHPSYCKPARHTRNVDRSRS
jgi:type II secretory pathway predicted ATPase ExeA